MARRSTSLERITKIRAISDQRGSLENSAVALLDVGQYADAEVAARQSLLWGIGSGKGQELLAESLNAQGKIEEALIAYKAIADRGGVFPRDMVPYATLLLESCQWAQAVNAYNKMLPNLPEGQSLAANSHFSPEVEQPTELVIALHIAQGLTYWGDPGWGTHARYEEAMREFSQALQLAPNAPVTNYYYGFGWQHLDLKSPTRAADALQAKAALQKASLSKDDSIRKAAEEALSRMR